MSVSTRSYRWMVTKDSRAGGKKEDMLSKKQKHARLTEHDLQCLAVMDLVIRSHQDVHGFDYVIDVPGVGRMIHDNGEVFRWRLFEQEE